MSFKMQIELPEVDVSVSDKKIHQMGPTMLDSVQKNLSGCDDMMVDTI